jgi:tetratricopeptide (TPR) repeat protein
MFRVIVAALVACSTLCAIGCSKDPEVAKREYLASGDAYVAQKKYAEAVVEYRNAIQQDPRFGQARYKLAEAYVELNQPVDAYREYIRAADLLPNDIDVQVKAARVLMAGGQFLDAQSRAEKALAINPKHVDAQLIKAASLAGMKKLDEAVGLVEDAIEAEPLRVGSHLDLGLLETLRGNNAAAEQAFKRALEANPDSIPAKMALANFYWMQKRPAESEALLKEMDAAHPKNAQINRALAAFYLSARQPALAEQPLKIVVDVTKEDSARMRLAEYYVAMGRRAEARALMESVAKGTGEAASMASVRLAAVAVLEHRVADAYKLIDEALQKYPKNQFALAARAEMFLRERKLDDALAAAKSAVSVAERPASAVQMVVGRIHVARMEFSEAVTAFNEAVRLNPRFIEPHLQLARTYLVMGRVDESLASAQEAMKLQPSNPEAHLAATRAYLAKGDTANADKSVKLLIASNPKAATVQAQLGYLELLRKNEAAARAAFDRALQADPNQPDALQSLNSMDIRAGKMAAARDRIERRVKAEPKNPALRLIAAQTYLATRDLPNAERALRETIDLDNANLVAYGLLGRIYASQKRLGEARVEYEQIARRLPKAAGPPTMVAMIYELQSNRDEARRWYEKALAADSNAPVASNNLAWITAEQGGNLDVAMQLAQAAKSRLPDNPQVDDTLGWVYYKKGLATLAITSFQASIQKDPKNPIYHYHLGLAYAKNGDKDKAKIALKEALALNPSFEGASEAQKTLASLS